MRSVLIFFHLFAFAAFVGSIFAHIVIGINFQPGDNMAAYTSIVVAKNLLTNTVIFSGLTISVISGVGLVWVHGFRFLSQGWLIAKIGLVTLVILNTTFNLAQFGRERSELAADAASVSDLPEHFATLGLREDVFGAGNLLLVLIIVMLSVRKRMI